MMTSFSAVARKEYWGGCNLSVGINLNVSKMSAIRRKQGSGVMLDALDGSSQDLCVGLRFYPALIMRVLMLSKAKP